MSLRGIAGLAVALAAVTATAFAVQEHDRREARGDSRPGERPRYVMAEVVTPTPDRRSGTPAGRLLVDSGWVEATSGTTGVPAPALRAYAQAQLSDVGGCGIGWTTLAGIGWVESQHGTLGGRVLGDDGRSSSRILGPALDGAGAFAAIRSTPASRVWHGDAVWEHAVGPMQFLPGTWRSWGADGDRDGSADPNDLDDAAAAAARYLCAAERDVLTGPGWAAAVLTYNRDRAYVDAVYAAASGYASRSTGS